MQTVYALPGIARRWSGLTTLIALATTVTLVRLSTLSPAGLAMSGARVAPTTFYMLHPHLGWDYFGFLMNGHGSSPAGGPSPSAGGYPSIQPVARHESNGNPDADVAGGGSTSGLRAEEYAEAGSPIDGQTPAGLVLSNGADGREQNSGVPPAKETVWSRPVRPTPGLYRMPISPVRPESGITTGLVVAYGHILQPPYRVEARGDAVFVNGVQVISGLQPPALVEQRRRYMDSLVAALPVGVRARADSEDAAIADARKTFDSLLPVVGNLAALDGAVRRLRGLPFVDSVVVDSTARTAIAKLAGLEEPVTLIAPQTRMSDTQRAWLSTQSDSVIPPAELKCHRALTG
jgi:hypothetical protein